MDYTHHADRETGGRCSLNFGHAHMHGTVIQYTYVPQQTYTVMHAINLISLS